MAHTRDALQLRRSLLKRGNWANIAVQDLQPEFVVLQDVSDHLRDCEILALGPWYNGNCYILARKVNASDFPINDHPYLTRSNLQVRVLEVSEYGVGVFDLPGVQPYLSFVQPLPDRRFLVGSSRTRYLPGKKEYEPNALIVTEQGEQLGRLSLGDAVEDVQATKDGTFWASYFDEGMTGPPRQSGGGRHQWLSGLVHWSPAGEILYEYPPGMMDCYAINLENDRSIWTSYYTGFPLVNIVEDRVDRSYPATICGASLLAISRRGVLFGQGYGIEGGERAQADRTIWGLCRFSGDEMQLVQEFELPGCQQGVNLIAARGSHVFWLKDGLFRRLDVSGLFGPH